MRYSLDQQKLLCEYVFVYLTDATLRHVIFQILRE
jgi:hypothetical protein